MDPMVQLAVLQPDGLDAVVHVLLKWSYMFHTNRVHPSVFK
jgi:hypothetical protein